MYRVIHSKQKTKFGNQIVRNTTEGWIHWIMQQLLDSNDNFSF